MDTKIHPGYKKSTKNLTIGILIDELYYEIPVAYFKAVKEIGTKHGINVFYIVCDAMKSPLNYQIQANILYDLPHDKNIDGLIISSNILGAFISHKEFTSLCHSYNPIPTVSAGMIIEGLPSVIIDNKHGISESVSHLIDIHGHTKIAYICGPMNHPDAKERYDAFTETLNDHGLPIDEELILPGNFQVSTGQKAISILIDDRKKLPGKDVQAIVTANDYMATGALKELQIRGYRVPEDIAIVGFDDIIQVQFTNPSISTVHLSFYEMGKQAAELLISLLKGEQVPAVLRIPATFVKRQSCGCPDSSDTESDYSVYLPKDVLMSLHSEPNKFFHNLSEKISNAELHTKDLIVCSHILSLLNHPELQNSQGKNNEEMIILPDKVKLILEMAVYDFIQNSVDIRHLISIATEIASTLGISESIDTLERQLSKFGVHRCYLSLYENPPPFTFPQKIPEFSRLYLAIDESGRLNLPPEGLVFPTRNLVPENILKVDDSFRFIVLPIYFQKEQIGFWLMDDSKEDVNFYSFFTMLVGSSLQGALMLKRLKEQSQELESANKKILSLIEQLKDENLRISTEMEVARHIQLALLPENIRTIHPDFRIAARMITAAEVGGDYYDISLDRNGTLWLGIGDVSGHGVTAGLIMMMAQTAHTTITSNFTATAGDIIMKINNVLYKNVYDRMDESLYMTFTTMKYLGNGQFQYAGSHLDLLVYRQQTKTCEQIETAGTWLNLKPDIRNEIKNEELNIGIGDILILYTDGLTEVFNKQKKLLDTEGFMNIIARHAEKDVETMQDAIFEDVKAWNDGDPKDDMSLVIVRRIA
ncbi:MAG: substrate-binding domain-containing protein [Spirochaetales bacterium]|nr:substrate-binding domain-containing protein [Spirochaetales bacterium]